MSRSFTATFVRPVFRWAAVFLACLVGAATLLALSPSIGIDAAVYVLIGRLTNNGLTPYRDIWEAKPPGLFVLSAASGAVGDLTGIGDVTSWRLVSALSVATLATSVASLTRRYARDPHVRGDRRRA